MNDRDEEDHTCSNCQGTGECPSCCGEGEDDCPECEGSGVCDDCGGTGEVL